MLNLELIVTIINREDGEKFEAFYQKEGVVFALQVYGKGTANREILAYLGLGDSNKLVLFSVVHQEKAHELIRTLNVHMRLDKPGAIAFTVPMHALGGLHSLQILTGDTNIGAEGAAKMEHRAYAHEVIIAIVNKGYVENVMEAAREAGAKGGTSIHARGMGGEKVEKFFGVSIQREKEMVFIVVDHEVRQQVMRAVSLKAGPQTEAHGAIFSLPVTDVAGIS